MSRPQSVKSTTIRITTGCGKLYATISDLSEEYQEVFLRLGKCGGCALAFLDGIGRLISLGSNQLLTKELVARAFLGIRCPSPTWHDGIQVLSCLDGVAKLLQEESNEPNSTVE